MSLDARDAAALFEPTRLRLARQLNGMTRAEVARRAEVSPAAVSQFESGAARPKAATLGRLALALAVPVRLLAGTGQRTLLPSVEDSFFRSLRRTTQRDRERAAAHAGLAAELVRQVERSVVLPDFNGMPDLALDESDDVDAAEAAANELRQRWEVPDGPVEHLLRTVERHGTVVVRSPLLTSDVDAFSWAGGDRPIVVLGSDKGVYERSRLDAAHELAHVLLHAADPEPASPPLEQQAQRFAAAFLVPADALESEWPTGRINWSELQRLRQTWGMSMAALLYRAKELELLSHGAYTSAVKYMSRRGWRVREPGVRRKPEEPALLAEALGLLEASGMSLDQLAEEAHLPLADDLTARLRIRIRPPMRVAI